MKWFDEMTFHPSTEIEALRSLFLVFIESIPDLFSIIDTNSFLRYDTKLFKNIEVAEGDNAKVFVFLSAISIELLPINHQNEVNKWKVNK